MRKQHELFVQEMLKHGNKTLAYQTAYPGISTNHASCGAWRLMKMPEIQHALKDLDAQALQKAERAGRTDLIFFTYAEKRDLLRRIALGEVMLVKRTKKNGEWKIKEVVPTMMDRLRAIDMDNRMAGEYAPDKLQVAQYATGFIINITGEGWAKKAA